jgi:hypothetical protein
MGIKYGRSRPIDMSAMSQQLQIIEGIENISFIPETQSPAEPIAGKDLPAGSSHLKALLRILGALLLSPLLLAIASVGFLIVLADFCWFRLREIRYGHPEPKGLWEF